MILTLALGLTAIFGEDEEPTGETAISNLATATPEPVITAIPQPIPTVTIAPTIAAASLTACTAEEQAYVNTALETLTDMALYMGFLGADISSFNPDTMKVGSDAHWDWCPKVDSDATAVMLAAYRVKNGGVPSARFNGMHSEWTRMSEIIGDGVEMISEGARDNNIPLLLEGVNLYNEAGLIVAIDMPAMLPDVCDMPIVATQ